MFTTDLVVLSELEALALEMLRQQTIYDSMSEVNLYDFFSSVLLCEYGQNYNAKS